MFQTQLNIALQSYASGGLTFLMRLVSATGYEQFFVAAILIVRAGKPATCP